MLRKSYRTVCKGIYSIYCLRDVFDDVRSTPYSFVKKCVYTGDSIVRDWVVCKSVRTSPPYHMEDRGMQYILRYRNGIYTVYRLRFLRSSGTRQLVSRESR